MTESMHVEVIQEKQKKVKVNTDNNGEVISKSNNKSTIEEEKVPKIDKKKQNNQISQEKSDDKTLPNSTSDQKQI